MKYLWVVILPAILSFSIHEIRINIEPNECKVLEQCHHNAHDEHNFSNKHSIQSDTPTLPALRL